jgi:hypothetical protein
MSEEVDIPKWVYQMAEDIAVYDLTHAKLTKKYNKARTTIWKYTNLPEIKKIIEDRRQELVEQYRSKMNTLVSKAFDTYYQALHQNKMDKYKFDAATTLLKSLGLLNDKQQVEHSGGLTVTISNELGREYK